MKIIFLVPYLIFDCIEIKYQIEQTSSIRPAPYFSPSGLTQKKLKIFSFNPIPNELEVVQYLSLIHNFNNMILFIIVILCSWDDLYYRSILYIKCYRIRVKSFITIINFWLLTANLFLFIPFIIVKNKYGSFNLK